MRRRPVGILRRRRPGRAASSRDWFLRLWFSGDRSVPPPPALHPAATVVYGGGTVSVRTVRGVAVAVAVAPTAATLHRALVRTATPPDLVLLLRPDPAGAALLRERGYHRWTSAGGVALYTAADLPLLDAPVVRAFGSSGVAAVLRLRCRVRFDGAERKR